MKEVFACLGKNPDLFITNYSTLAFNAASDP